VPLFDIAYKRLQIFQHSDSLSLNRVSHATRHTSHVTRHTSHVTRHTSHVTRHTSHVTRHTSHVTRQAVHEQTCKVRATVNTREEDPIFRKLSSRNKCSRATGTSRADIACLYAASSLNHTKPKLLNMHAAPSEGNWHNACCPRRGTCEGSYILSRGLQT
jgi:hypothetical protein